MSDQEEKKELTPLEWLEIQMLEHPQHTNIYQPVVDRLRALRDGQPLTVENPQFGAMKLRIATSVWLPSNMSLGEFFAELKRIEKLVNENSKIKTQFEMGE